MRVMWIAVLGMVLAGCGQSGDTEAKAPASSPTPSHTASPTALREVCPQVEQDAPTGRRVSHADMAQFLVTLAAFSESGDAETQLALDPLRGAVGNLNETAVEGGNQGPAWARFDAAIDRLAKRCAAVGSGAFQH